MSRADAEVFRKAAEILETDGWTQGNYHASDGHCALGAIEVALVGKGHFITDDELQRRWDGLGMLFARHLGLPDFHVPSWNDAEGRTQEDVIKGFLTAADKEDVA